MRTVGFLLGAVFSVACTEPIGDRCGEALPPCARGDECVNGHCVAVMGGGAATSGGAAGGASSGGAAGGSALDAGRNDDGGVSDAGTVDAGSGDGGADSGIDAGSLPDAGRVLMVIDRDLYVQRDGGVEEHARPDEAVNAVFMLLDGGALRLPMATDGGGVFVVGNAPSGPWVAERSVPDITQSYYALERDVGDISTALRRGRPGLAQTTSTTFALDLTFQAWEQGDSLALSSQSAGSLFVFVPVGIAGSTTFYGMLRPASAFGPAIRSSDDIRVNQFRSFTLDSGVEGGRVIASADVTGFAIPGAFVSATLQPSLPTASIAFRSDAGAIAALLGQSVHPTCSVDVFELTANELPDSAPQLGYVDLDVETRVDFDFAQRGDGQTGVTVRCAGGAVSQLAVPLLDGGFESSDAGLIRVTTGPLLSITDRVQSDGGLVSQPSLGIPRSVLIDGQPSPNIVTPSPELSWLGPTLGAADRYTVLVRRLTRSANSILRANVAVFRTEGTRLRVPAGVLVPGERYLFEVTALQSSGFGAGRPWPRRLPSHSATTQSAAVVVSF